MGDKAMTCTGLHLTLGSLESGGKIWSGQAERNIPNKLWSNIPSRTIRTIVLEHSFIDRHIMAYRSKQIRYIAVSLNAVQMQLSLSPLDMVFLTVQLSSIIFV